MALVTLIVLSYFPLSSSVFALNDSTLARLSPTWSFPFDELENGPNLRSRARSTDIFFSSTLYDESALFFCFCSSACWTTIA
ncbi:hypothetical protein Hanom_Chr07g00637761 [Helianthus anomalus]